MENIGNEKNSPEQFFETLDYKLEREMQNIYRFRILICGQLIELRFPSKKDAEQVERDLVGLISNDEREQDVVFQFWTDDYYRYLNAEERNKRCEYRSKNGSALFASGWMMTGMNLESRTFYYCRPLARANGTYGIITLFYLWARTRDLLVLHSAAVGVNGRGVLIAAQGGGGKSTLSVSCLLEDMDFVSDDHLLVNRHGPLQAMPLYKTVKLNPDMLERIGVKLPVIWTDASRKGKKIMDASGCPFCSHLSVTAIISPVITDGGQPEIIHVSPEPVLDQLIQSTWQQIGTFRNFDVARAIITRFCGLPVYELRLCKNLSKNVELLHRFIEKEK